MNRILINKLSFYFSRIVREELKDELPEIIRLNAEEYRDRECCATHDFCDANMLMDEAFRQAMGKDLNAPPMEYFFEDLQIWNAAWSQAKRNNFRY